MSESTAKPKLKWHRFIQFVLLPLSIIASVYQLISYFADLFGFDFSWTSHTLRDILNAAGQDVFHLGVYFWPVIAILSVGLLRLILQLYAWIGSFRWRRYSYRCWLALLTIGLIAAAGSIYVIWEYGINRGGIIGYMANFPDTKFEYTAALQVATKVMLVLIGLLALLYTIANFVYYGKRKHLFNSGDEQLPYEDDEDEDEEEEIPVITENKVPETKPEPEVIEVKPAAEDPKPEPSVQKEIEETAELSELDLMLKDTEDALSNLGAKEEPVKSIAEEPEPEVIMPQESDAEPLPFTRGHGVFEEPEEEPAQIIEEPLPFADERDIFEEPEEEPMEETQILTPVQEPVQQEAINFCPECGKRIPDPGMRYCIYCGHKIR